MSYVTQGTVQVERKGGRPEGEVTIMLSPAAGYAIKHEGRDYAAFVGPIGQRVKAVKTALIRERTAPFTTRDEDFKKMLVEAAIAGTRVEIAIESNRSNQIVYVRIPATPRSNAER